MVRVSASAVNDIVTKYHEHVQVEILADEAETIVTEVRDILGKKLVPEHQQIHTVARALLPVKACILDRAPHLQTAWAEDDWSECFWDLLEPCISHTLAGQTCSSVFESAELWSAAVADALRETLRVVEREVPSRWSYKGRIVLFLVAAALLALATPNMFDITARGKVTSALSATALVGIATLCFFFGPTAWQGRQLVNNQFGKVRRGQASQKLEVRSKVVHNAPPLMQTQTPGRR